MKRETQTTDADVGVLRWGFQRINARTWTAIGTVFAIAACLYSPTRTLLFGWIPFASRVIPEVEVNWALLGIGIASWVGIVSILHYLCCWWKTQSDPGTDDPFSWRLSSSLSISLLIVVMFCAGLAAVGVTHQVAWLIRSPNDWFVQKIGATKSISEDFDLTNQLRSIDLGMRNYAAQHRRLPFAAGDDQATVHSWPSRVVGTMYSMRKMTRFPHLAWDHEKNHDYYTRVFPDLLNPTLENAPQHNPEGYGLSHFEANANIKDFSYEEFDRGTSGIIMIGEVRSKFQPWGKPNTDRHPELGLNQSPDGFGGPPSRDSVMFLLMDGSVRTISDTVDPQVLHALSGAKH